MLGEGGRREREVGEERAGTGGVGYTSLLSSLLRLSVCLSLSLSPHTFTVDSFVPFLDRTSGDR